MSAPATTTPPPKAEIPRFNLTAQDLIPILGSEVTEAQVTAFSNLLNRASHHQLFLTDRMISESEKVYDTRLGAAEEYMNEGQQRRFWSQFEKAYPDMAEHLPHVRQMQLGALPEGTTTKEAAMEFIYKQAASQLQAINPALKFTATDTAPPPPSNLGQTPPAGGAAPAARVTSIPLTPSSRPPVAPQAPASAIDPTAPREITAAEIFAQQ